jgi:hypothetical protein
MGWGFAQMSLQLPTASHTFPAHNFLLLRRVRLASLERTLLHQVSMFFVLGAYGGAPSQAQPSTRWPHAVAELQARLNMNTALPEENRGRYKTLEPSNTCGCR